MSTTLREEWKTYFIAYEDALASFHSLQDVTEQTLEQSRAAMTYLNHMASLRTSIYDVRRRPQASADNGRVAEIERDHATIELDGIRIDVSDLVATRGAAFGSVLELSFRIDPKLVPARRSNQAGSNQVPVRRVDVRGELPARTIQVGSPRVCVSLRDCRSRVDAAPPAESRHRELWRTRFPRR